MSILLIPEQSKEKIESPEERAERIGLPNYKIEDLLKEFKCEDAIGKIKENDIDDEQFWDLEEGDFESILDIKIFGRRKKLYKKIQEIKKTHEKDMEELKKLEEEVDKSGLT